MSAAAGTVAKPPIACEYCDKPIRECMCCTAPTYSRYCAGCDRTTADCLCGTCRTCSLALDKCACPCATCKYPGDKCRCYEEYEPHPDALCCPHCYSDPADLRTQVRGEKPSPRTAYAGMDPCECEANARQRDLNASKDFDCPSCEESIKYCRCKPAGSHYDSEDD